MATRAGGTGGPRGFTLVEVLIVCAVAVLLAAIVVPSYRSHQLRAGRIDAVDALTRVQTAQEAYRSLHGLYTTELAALQGAATLSPQGRYRISLALTGPESYLATASALGPQADDSGCVAITLEVHRGYPREGPEPACWRR